MSLLEETEYDVIIIGTGLVESMLAGALARIGKKILHLDENDFYGGNYSTLTLRQFHDWFNNDQSSSTTTTTTDEDHQNNEAASATDTNNYTTIEVRSDKPYKKLRGTDQISAELSAQQRRFNIDLVPKALLCRGPLVELLISSSVGRYLTFKLFMSSLLFLDNSFEKVPCSKGDIFQNKFISPIEKRYLMKFMHFCLEYDSTEAGKKMFDENKDKPFAEFLDSQKLSPKLQSFIFYAIALFETDQSSKNKATQKATTKEGLERMKLYLSSLGRYGNNVFLYPIYGMGEIAQAFCRVAAVYGATYVLRRTAKSLLINPQTNLCEGIITNDDNNQKLSCKYLITSSDVGIMTPTANAPDNASSSSSSSNNNNNNKQNNSSDDNDDEYMVHRYVCITGEPLFKGDDRQLANASVPPYTFGASQHHTIYITQLDHTADCAPNGKYVIYFSTRITQETAEETSALDACVGGMIELEETEQGNATTSADHNTKPTALYYTSFVQRVRDPNRFKKNKGARALLPENVFVCPDPDSAMHADSVVDTVKGIFYSICKPEEEFLPALPNPEEETIYDSTSVLLGVDKEVAASSSSPSSETWPSDSTTGTSSSSTTTTTAEAEATIADNNTSQQQQQQQQEAQQQQQQEGPSKETTSETSDMSVQQQQQPQQQQ